MRSRLISANSSRKMLLKPRFGSRRCSGIWPPSKPLMRTPERAVWPLPPRPAVLPLPEPMPRPTRMRFLREPALSAISLSFIVRVLYLWSMIATEIRFPVFGCDHAPILFLVDDADEMLNLGDHAANCRGVLQLGDPADLVELEADQRRTLRVVAADRAAGLLDLDHLCGLGHRHYSVTRESACCLFGHRFGVAADAARLQGGHLDVAARRDRTRRILMLQRVEGGANHVVGVRRADRFRHHVLDAQRLEHRAHRAAGDDAGTGGRRAQIDASGAVAAG